MDCVASNDNESRLTLAAAVQRFQRVHVLQEQPKKSKTTRAERDRPDAKRERCTHYTDQDQKAT